MVLDLRFHVRGLPQPQGSSRAFLPRGWSRPVITCDNPRVAGWRQEAAAACCGVLAAAGWREGDGPLLARPRACRVELEFFLPRPASLPKRVGRPCVRPDLDKLVRAALDAWTGLLYADDSQVVEIAAAKLYGPAPGMLVRACEVGAERALVPQAGWLRLASEAGGA